VIELWYSRFVILCSSPVCCEHLACHVFLCAMCSPVYCLAPPFLLSDYCLICSTCLSCYPPFVCCLFSLPVFCLFIIWIYFCSYLINLLILHTCILASLWTQPWQFPNVCVWYLSAVTVLAHLVRFPEMRYGFVLF